MSKVLELLGYIPAARRVQAGVLAAVLMTVAGLFAVGGAPRQFAPLLLIALIVGVLFWEGIRWVLARREKSKAATFDPAAASMAAGSGASTADAKALEVKLLSDLEAGIKERFKYSGGNLYAVPWYVLVGPPKSGKSRLMARSHVTDEKDKFLGVGGTAGMHWWITGGAAMLDLAGAVFMDQGQTGRWERFLDWLKEKRHLQPINGALLVVSVEDLLGGAVESGGVGEMGEATEKTTAESVAMAAAVRGQLDRLREKLDVRFPVWVVVTKCDKLPGFKELFSTIDDFKLQQQLLGWSAPKDLNAAFKGAEFDQHLEQVIHRLRRYRMSRLREMIRARDPRAGLGAGGRQTDQADPLFTLTQELRGLVPRLRMYLDGIFTPKPLSPTPPFLRGVYFTSAEQTGSAIWKHLGKIGMRLREDEPVLDRSFFLRDLFMEKIFKEQGLVTRAGDVQKDRRQKLAIRYGGAAAVLALLLGWTAWGYLSFKASVEDHRQLLAAVTTGVTGKGSNNVSIINGARYEGSSRWPELEETSAWKRILGEAPRGSTPAEAIEYFRQLAIVRPVKQPWIFSLIAAADRAPPAEKVRDAYDAFIAASLLDPLINGAMTRLTQDPALVGSSTQAPSDPARLGLKEQTEAIASMLAVLTLAHGGNPIMAEPGPAQRGGVATKPVESILGPLLKIAAPQSGDATLPSIELDDLRRYAEQRAKDWRHEDARDKGGQRSRELESALRKLQSVLAQEGSDSEFGKFQSAIIAAIDASNTLTSFENEALTELKQVLDGNGDPSAVKVSSIQVGKFDKFCRWFGTELVKCKSDVTNVVNLLTVLVGDSANMDRALNEAKNGAVARVAEAKKTLSLGLPLSLAGSGGAGATTGPATFISWAVGLVDEIYNKANETLQNKFIEVEKLKESSSAVARLPASSQWSIKARLDILEKANESINAVNDWTSTRAKLGSSTDLAGLLATVKGLDVWTQNPHRSGDDLLKNASSIHKEVIRRCQAKALHLEVVERINNAPADEETLKQRVAQQAKLPDGMEKLLTKINPTASIEKYKQYDPDGCKAVIGLLLDPAFRQPAGGPVGPMTNRLDEIMDWEAVRRLVSERMSKFSAYTADLRHQWSTELRKDLKPKAESRADFIKFLHDFDVKTDKRAVNDVIQHANDALGLVQSPSGGSGEAMSLADDGRVTNWLNEWRPLQADISVSDHQKKVKSWSMDVRSTDSVFLDGMFFWDEMSVRALELLKDEILQERRTRWDKLARACEAAPLASDGSPDTVIDKKALEEVRALLKELSSSRFDPRTFQPLSSDRWKEGAARAKSSLEVIWGTSTAVSEEEQTQIKVLLEACDFLVAATNKSFVYQVPVAPTPDEESVGVILSQQYMRQSDSKATVSTRSPCPPNLSWSVSLPANESLTWEFLTSEESPTAASSVSIGGWRLLAGLGRDGHWSHSEEGLRLRVDVGPQEAVWLLTKSLGKPPDSWPSKKNWRLVAEKLGAK